MSDEELANDSVARLGQRWEKPIKGEVIRSDWQYEQTRGCWAPTRRAGEILKQFEEFNYRKPYKPFPMKSEEELAEEACKNPCGEWESPSLGEVIQADWQYLANGKWHPSSPRPMSDGIGSL